MRTSPKAANWIVGSLLAAALAFAPIAPALGCTVGMIQQPATVGMPSMAATSAKPVAGQSHQMNMAAMASAPAKPCDSPCKDCSSDAAKKSCTSACACAPVMIAIAPISPVVRTIVATVEPHDLSAPHPLARPPDTPPPRSLA